MDMKDYGMNLEYAREKYENTIMRNGKEDLLTLELGLQYVISLNEYSKSIRAFRLCKEIYEIRTNILGQKHIDTLRTAAEYGNCLTLTGQYSEAEKIDRSSYDTAKEVLGIGHPLTIMIQTYLINDLQNMKRYEEALVLLDSAMKMEKELNGEISKTYLNYEKTRAIIMFDANKGKAFVMESLPILGNKFITYYGSTDYDTLSFYHDYAKLLFKYRNSEKALYLMEETFSLALENIFLFGKELFEIARDYVEIGTACGKHNRIIQKLAEYRLKVESKKKNENLIYADELLCNIDKQLVYVYREMGKRDKSSNLCKIIYEKYKNLYGEIDCKTCQAFYDYADEVLQQGEVHEAMEMLQNIYEIQCEKLGENSLLTKQTKSKILIAKEYTTNQAGTILSSISEYKVAKKIYGEYHYVAVGREIMVIRALYDRSRDIEKQLKHLNYIISAVFKDFYRKEEIRILEEVCCMYAYIQMDSCAYLLSISLYEKVKKIYGSQAEITEQVNRLTEQMRILQEAAN